MEPSKQPISIDILDYLGKFENGVLTFISLGYEGVFYDASFFYKENILALTPDEELEKKLGCVIEDWVGYRALMLDIVEKVIPYEEIINRLDDFDPSKYNLHKDDNTNNPDK